MSVKYKDVIKEMYQQYADELTKFKQVHDQYATNRKEFQEKYNEVGKPIREIMEDYERKLCRQTEGGAYAAYSHKLAEKFWTEIKKTYPYIDFVGMRML